MFDGPTNEYYPENETYRKLQLIEARYHRIQRQVQQASAELNRALPPLKTKIFSDPRKPQATKLQQINSEAEQELEDTAEQKNRAKLVS